MVNVWLFYKYTKHVTYEGSNNELKLHMNLKLSHIWMNCIRYILSTVFLGQMLVRVFDVFCIHIFVDSSNLKLIIINSYIKTL